MSNTNHLIVISGCSGGGKSTLIAELARRGHAVIEEPGRRLLREELARGGTALPWADKAGFVRRILDLAVKDHVGAQRQDGPVFFDRSVVDALSALDHLTGEPALATLGGSYRYAQRVFLAPPWPEIYVTDDERRHAFAAAEREYHRLARDYPARGYEAIELLRLPVADPADFVLEQVAAC